MYKHVIHNNTNQKIQLLLRHKNTKDQWETIGWFHYKPGEKKLLRYLLDPKFLYYASSFNDKMFWRGDQTRQYKGKSYKMKVVNIKPSLFLSKKGKFELTLN